MRCTLYVGTLALWATTILGKELPVDETLAAEMYDSGIMHEKMKKMKLDFWDSEIKSGAMDSSQHPPLGFTSCVNGYVEAIPGDANYRFKCKNIDLYSFLSHADLGSSRGQGSSSWGWTDPSSRREFVVIAQYMGCAFVEVTKEGKMLYLGYLPTYDGVGSQWKDTRGYKNYMIIGSEATNHGIQIFDMRKLLTINPSSPVMFDNNRDLAGHYKGLPQGSTHNVVINEEKEYIVSVGAVPRSGTCKSGLIFIDMKDPTRPTEAGCAGMDGYVHDAQCVVYRGPDTKYQGKDICYGYNEDTLTIYDVTNKRNSRIISRTSYTGASYTHQGWTLDENWQKYLLLDDEGDEQARSGPASNGKPVTYIWDMTSLENPKQTGHFQSPVRGIDHNQYVVGDYAYQSHYGLGLRVVDVSSIPSDPTGRSVCEVAYLDIYPEDDNSSGGGDVAFTGSWSSYAYLPSGFIFVNTIERGGFIVKVTKKEPCP